MGISLSNALLPLKIGGLGTLRSFCEGDRTGFPNRVVPVEPSHARGEVYLSFVRERGTTSELPGYPRLERYHPLDDVHMNEDDPPAREVVADTSIHSLPHASLPLKTSLDLGIL